MPNFFHPWHKSDVRLNNPTPPENLLQEMMFFMAIRLFYMAGLRYQKITFQIGIRPMILLYFHDLRFFRSFVQWFSELHKMRQKSYLLFLQLIKYLFPKSCLRKVYRHAIQIFKAEFYLSFAYAFYSFYKNAFSLIFSNKQVFGLWKLS